MEDLLSQLGAKKIARNLPLHFFAQSPLMQSTEIMDAGKVSFQVIRIRNSRFGKWKYSINIVSAA